MKKSILNKETDVQLKKKFDDSEMRYRRLFETAQDGILILDFETGNIVDANPYIIEIIDYPLKEILGKKLWEIGLFGNKEQSEIAFTELKTNGYIRFEDMPIPRKNGKITEVEFISNVYLVNDVKVIQCNIRNITDRKEVEHVLIEREHSLKKQNDEYIKLNKEYSALNDQLTESINRIQNINDELINAKVKADESDTLKSAFLANMSHEIRTPMNAIMGFSELLLEPDISKVKLDDFVKIINSSSLQLMSIISDIIDISKIESGQITIRSELVDINSLMTDLVETYNELIEHKKLILEYSQELPYDLIQTTTDGNRVRQVLCNLLNNAIKFTKEGKIEFGYKIKEDFIEFYVKDSGIGIDPGNHALIFQRFRQVETTTAHLCGGNGLGLTISKALVEKMGGTINVSSNLGEGSVFTFTIPYLKFDKNDSVVELTDKSKPINWNNKTILLVEDDLNNHAYAIELLSNAHVRILNAWDGRQAVEQVKNNPEISLVLMDIKMPIMDGYEALRLIKLIRPKLPVIAQTAYALSHDEQKAIAAGFDNYIAKPIRKPNFMKILNTYLA